MCKSRGCKPVKCSKAKKKPIVKAKKKAPVKAKTKKRK